MRSSPAVIWVEPEESSPEPNLLVYRPKAKARPAVRPPAISFTEYAGGDSRALELKPAFGHIPSLDIHGVSDRDVTETAVCIQTLLQADRRLQVILLRIWYRDGTSWPGAGTLNPKP